MDGGDCMPAAQGMVNACQLDATTACTCSRRSMTYRCGDIPTGTGGRNSGGGTGGTGGTNTAGTGGTNNAGTGGFVFGNAMCGDAPMNGDACTGIGPCAGSDTCRCSFQTMKVTNCQ
jgi:hypothetical protein